MTRDIGLVSCVKSKRDEPAPPRELYTSDYFAKMCGYAKKNHDDWYIPSAKYGLLEPDGKPIAPYDGTLRDFSKAEQWEWAKRVMEQKDNIGFLKRDISLMIHAGKDYCEELLPLIEDRAESVDRPTEGLAIGKMKAWYKETL